MNGAARADEIADALLAAAPAARAAIWERSVSQPAPALAWALKRACDAAWNTEPATTAVVAGLVEDLAASRPQAEVQALAAWMRGIAHLAQGQMEAAVAALERADAGFRDLGRPVDAAQTRISLLMALAMLGRYDDAFACGADARAVFDSAGDSRAAGKIELNLGNLAARRDHHDAAVHHYREALARFAAAGDAELEVMTTKGLADIHAQRHEFEPALALYRQAQADAARGGFAMLAALIDGDLGALELRRGHYDLALPSLERSRATLAQLERPHDLAVAEESLGDAYLELNLLPEALALYESSLASYERAGAVTDRAWALSQRGRALTLLGRHAAAATSLAQAEQAFADEGNPTGVALVRLWLAELAMRQRDPATAAHHAAAAEPALLQARRLGAVLQARLLRAEALRGSGDAAQAEQLALAACATAGAEDLDLTPALRRARVLLGLLARDRGDADAARRCFEAAVASIESQRGTLPSEEFRAAFLGDNLLPYHELVRASLAQPADGAADTALQWVERGRARALADSLEGSGHDDDSADPARREGARLRRELDACYRALSRPGDDGAARWLEQARRLEAALLEAGRRSAIAGAPAAPAAGAAASLDIAALHAALDTHSALVEYFSIDDTLHVCVVAGGRVHALRLPAELQQVQASIEQLRFQTDTLRHGAQRLAHRLPELQQRALHHLQGLHAALWAPLEPLLGERRAVVVPHGALHYLPFEALHDGRRHEIERRELCRAPSAALLLRSLAARPSSWRSALVLGHADERLPQVRAEVDAVAARFDAAQALHDEAATSAALRSACGADVLHIACHAQFRNDSPRFSALHLADGAFTVRDAARLRLAGALVTLSACETAISAVLPGDELIGLTHAFLAAGAARVLASLWTVQDDAAARFMPRFYERLHAGSAPAEALRATQLEALGHHPHPYFWSAFTLHGGW